MVSWHERARCRETWVDPALFDPKHDRETDERFAARIEIAKSICATCSVVAECLQDANANGDIGVRGGIYLNIKYLRRRRPLKPCGTDAAFRRHRKNGETCARCEQAKKLRRDEGVVRAHQAVRSTDGRSEW